MISAPNSWAPIKEAVWTVVDPNATTIWFQLLIVDSLGTRPYATATGSTLSVTFRRSDLLEQDPQRKLARTAQSLTKTATFNAQNRALGSFTLTTQDVQKLTSGAAFFTFTESGSTTQWLQDWLVRKQLTSQGF